MCTIQILATLVKCMTLNVNRQQRITNVRYSGSVKYLRWRWACITFFLHSSAFIFILIHSVFVLVVGSVSVCHNSLSARRSEVYYTIISINKQTHLFHFLLSLFCKQNIKTSMSDGDFLAFSNDTPIPQTHNRGARGHANYQPYSKPQRGWKNNHQQKNSAGQGNRSYNNQHHQSGVNPFYRQSDDNNTFSPPSRFGNSPDGHHQSFPNNNFSNSRHSSGGPVRGRHNNNGRQRSGFGYQHPAHQHQHRKFQNNANGSHFQKV